MDFALELSSLVVLLAVCAYVCIANIKLSAALHTNLKLNLIILVERTNGSLTTSLIFVGRKRVGGRGGVNV